MSLPLAKRYEIVFLSLHPLGPQLSNHAISDHIKCDRKTVRYWLNRWQKSEDLTDLPLSGRPRCTSEKTDSKIVSIAQKERDIVSDQISKKMKKEGVDISARTIRRRLRESGGSYGPPLMKPLLTEDHREKRLLWARQHQHFNWDRVIFTDEKTFELCRGVRKVWRFPTSSKVVRRVKHPPKLHVWGCFSKRGFGKLICFKQNLTGIFMCSIYEKGLLPFAQRQFPEGPNNWILQEDNDPKHKCRRATEWKAEKGVQILPWPASSPDQNPIENVWSILEMQISEKKIRTIRGLRQEVQKAWNALPTELAAKLVDSMKNRVKCLIANNGDYTLY